MATSAVETSRSHTVFIRWDTLKRLYVFAGFITIAKLRNVLSENCSQPPWKQISRSVRHEGIWANEYRLRLTLFL